MTSKPTNPLASLTPDQLAALTPAQLAALLAALPAAEPEPAAPTPEPEPTPAPTPASAAPERETFGEAFPANPAGAKYALPDTTRGTGSAAGCTVYGGVTGSGRPVVRFRYGPSRTSVATFYPDALARLLDPESGMLDALRAHAELWYQGGETAKERDAAYVDAAVVDGIGKGKVMATGQRDASGRPTFKVSAKTPSRGAGSKVTRSFGYLAKPAAKPATKGR